MTDGLVAVRTPPCAMCGQTTDLEVDAAGMRMWHGGAHIQRAFPQLAPAERELLLTGTHPACWDKMFPLEDEDDDR
jgi:hypothetical protein